MTHYFIPQTVFPVRVPAREYAELVARIPAGYVTTSKEIEMFLAHRHGAERVEYDGPLPKFYDPTTNKVSVLPEEGTEPVPFYRVLSERGFVQETRSYSREMAMTLLQAEGHEVVPCGKGYRIAEYKARLYDLRGAFEVDGVVE